MCIFGFLAHGHGAKGDNIYTFQIEFLEPVNPQRQLSITVKKKETHWWERLTKQEKRPLFLAPDFDRWLDESDAELELKAKEEERINKISVKNRIPKDRVAVIQAIPIFTSTGKFSFTLNYPLNVTVPFSIVLHLYLIFFFLAPFILFRHLYKQRQRRLGPKKRKMH
ncbi:hypothetical protein E2320_013567 [Naja naja]|nr:hypothetical protein E2320_013567 [Naja naja]